MPQTSGIKFFLKNNFFNPDAYFLTLNYFIFKNWNYVYFEGIDGLLLSSSRKKSYSREWLDLITHFFGLPFFSSPQGYSKKQTFLAKFLGWDEKKFLLPINIFRAIFFLPLNFLLIIPRFLLNILKLGTEFIPYFLRQATNPAINHLLRNLKSHNKSGIIKLFSGVSLVVLFPLFFAFKVIHLVGRAITSPHRSLYAAWQSGKELGGENFLGKFFSMLFCLLSLALTTFAYLICFPILLKLAVTYLPAKIVSFIQTVMTYLPPLAKVGAPFEVIMTPIFKIMGAFFAKVSSPIILGLAIVVGVAVGPGIILMDKIGEGLAKFSQWWRQRPVEKKIETAKKQVGKIEDIIKKNRRNNPFARQQRNFENQQGIIRAQQKAQPLPAQHPPVHPLAKQPIVPRNTRPKFPPLPKKQDTNKLPMIPINQLTRKNELGRGGMGVVYKGTYNGQSVAIKMSLVAFGKDQSFEREMKILAKPNSPYVIKVHGIAVENSKPMIVMEFMSKGSLWDVLRNDPPAAQISYKIGIDTGQGIAYLHSIGIVHADLKSLNVLLDNQNNVKISDFGLAKLRKKINSNTAQTVLGPEHGNVGTVRWMAPELFAPKAKTTEKSDMWSYGIILLELLTRKIPFDGLNNIQAQSQITAGKMPAISSEALPSMAKLIGQCWNKRAENRPTAEVGVTMLEEEYKKNYKAF